MRPQNSQTNSGRPEAHAWQAPPELMRAVREVRKTGAGKLVAGIAVALAAGAVVGGAWLYALAGRDADFRVRIDREAIPARAEVLELRRTRGDDPKHIIRYRYTAGGQVYTGSTNVNGAYWRSLQLGSRIPIRYFPSQPEESWVRGYEPAGVPRWAAALAAAACAVSAALIRHILGRHRALLEHGRAALAQVTRVRKVSTGESKGYRVYYDYTVLSGARRTGRYHVSRKPPAVGSTLTVIYDRDEPQRSAPYPLKLWSVERRS